jgi:hypothetical protein
LACSAAAIATTINDAAIDNATINDARSFALDGQPAGTDIDMQALGLVAVLIELIAQDRDRDHQSADNQIEEIAASHGRPFSDKRIVNSG